jgi:hypothetical protein
MDGNWRPLADAVQEEELVEVHDLAASLVDSFPKVRENLSPRDNVVRIVTMIQKGKGSLFLHAWRICDTEIC